jgi:hypothetical protein
LPLSTYDTVLAETPACRATSEIWTMAEHAPSLSVIEALRLSMTIEAHAVQDKRRARNVPRLNVGARRDHRSASEGTGARSGQRIHTTGAVSGAGVAQEGGCRQVRDDDVLRHDRRTDRHGVRGSRRARLTGCSRWPHRSRSSSGARTNFAAYSSAAGQPRQATPDRLPIPVPEAHRPST